jgi:hypothetical protein
MADQQEGFDKKICKRLWENCTPWIQIGGFLILCGFQGGGYLKQFEVQAKSIDSLTLMAAEHDRRLGALEIHYSVIDQKLDDIRNYTFQHNRR